jgi:hypothetical protein
MIHRRASCKDVSAQEVIMKLVNSVVSRHVRNRRPQYQ